MSALMMFRSSHTLLAAILFASTFALVGCNGGTGPGDAAKNVKVEIQMEYEIGVLRDSTSDSLGLGFTFHSPLFYVHSEEDSRLRKEGVFLIAFPGHKPDSVDLHYFTAGSQEAWAPYVSLQDSLDARLLDTADEARYWEVSIQHADAYFAQKSLPESVCALSAPSGTARVQSGDVGLDVPIVIASIRRIDGGHVLTIDEEASRPPGAASVNLVGKAYTGTLILNCSVQL